ncbi:Fis family transcriptional regulator [Acidobacteria bacterium Mor1]|nr:Fis family transcriptional regulator [Acidobacteria bacterium Mor1]
MPTILITDDEPNIRKSLSQTFKLEGYRVETAGDGRQALGVLEDGGIDLVMLDLQMPHMDGLETLRELRNRGHAMPVMLLTAHGSIDAAVEAIKLGAFDFLEKPPHSEKVLLAARNALRQADLLAENAELRGEVDEANRMIGDSPALQALREQIQKVAPTQARVLILGENGTGKELIAHALHQGSPRAEGPFVRVNCAALPRELVESELFGHEKGAFTGATARRRGKFARADGGTLFLDEVGEIPLELQAKLLRALESGEIEPVGADAEQTVDVRVLAATNRDLEADVAEGRFRQDLFYRLQVVSLTAPALREHAEDIPPLARHFLTLACRENNIRPRTLDDDALERLVAHPWPGNVRELRNLVERLVIMASGETISEADVAAALPANPSLSGAGSGGGAATGVATEGALRDVMAQVERQVILDALERTNWVMAAAARELDLERSHLYKKLKAHGIEKG